MKNPGRSVLYIPGNSPGMIQSSAFFGADCILLDLEDAIALSEKDSARKLVSKALESLDFGTVERYVRINGADTPYFSKDIEEVVPSKPDALRLPKTQTAEDVRRADEEVSRVEEKSGIPLGSVGLHVMIETARGLVNIHEIAASSPRVKALTLGGHDLAADLGIRRTLEGMELLYARSRVVIAARAFGLASYDTVFTHVDDLDGLYQETKMVVGLGFTGKAAIHPSQVPVIHKAFRPEEREVEHAVRICRAASEAEHEGRGVYTVDGRMVDGPIVAQARRVLDLARISGMEGVDEI